MSSRKPELLAAISSAISIGVLAVVPIPVGRFGYGHAALMRATKGSANSPAISMACARSCFDQPLDYRDVVAPAWSRPSLATSTSVIVVHRLSTTSRDISSRGLGQVHAALDGHHDVGQDGRDRAPATLAGPL